MERNDLELLKKYQRGECNPQEAAIVESWYISYRSDAKSTLTDEELSQDLESIYQDLPVQKRKSQIVSFPLKIVAAAAIVIVIGVVAFLNLNINPVATASKPEQEIVPGSDKAILTLADGSKIVLDKAGEGELVNLANLSIRKTAEGKIVYVVKDEGESSPKGTMAYNTIQTPKGGQYEIQLPDGSKVWLNAASSLRYPVAFSSDERKVELTGEGYFEIAHNAKKPFRVISSGQTVEVLGTSFNLNAYDDEQSINTTLLEGSVKIVSGNSNRVIKPGQQAKLFRNSSINIEEVDTDAAVAWKNGYFKFNDTDLVSLMRQLSRWYDFDVVYEGKPTNEVFIGQIRRDASLTNVLKIIELGDVNFRVEGRTIYIKP